jgi:hypothetical protein
MCRMKFADLAAGYVVAALALTQLFAACGNSDGDVEAMAAEGAAGSVTAIGDSVMLAAKEQLDAAGVVVDAVSGRQTEEALLVLQRLEREGSLRETVVVHIGHNGPFSAEQFDRFVEVAGPNRRVIFLTVRVPREWETANNDVIAAGAARYENVSVLDFRGATEGRPELFWDDGLHLRPEGADFYAAFVLDGLP